MAGRGDELQRARKRRPGLSREKLSKITGVSARTIQRIESGESATSANVEKLEHELAPELAEVAAERLIDPGLAGPPSRTLSEASSLELAAELMKRIVAEHATTPRPGTSQEPRPAVFEWKTEDYPDEGDGPLHGPAGVADG